MSEEIYHLFSDKPRQWQTGKFTKMCGLYFDLSGGQNIVDIFKMTQEEYDKFATEYSSEIKNILCNQKYDVQMLCSDGVYVSYTFELFRKLIFGTNNILTL